MSFIPAMAGNFSSVVIDIYDAYGHLLNAVSRRPGSPQQSDLSAVHKHKHTHKHTHRHKHTQPSLLVMYRFISDTSLVMAMTVYLALPAPGARHHPAVSVCAGNLTIRSDACNSSACLVFSAPCSLFFGLL